MTDKINILLANPRGFCAGVERAIQIVEEALIQYGKPIYVRHEVVHNQHVINDLKTKGAIFIEDLNHVPKGAHVIFSAHGISKVIREEAKLRELIPIDATCPLVTKVHVEVNKMPEKGIKKLAVVTPAFVSDCLETLEEIAMEANHEFKAHGGEEFLAIPCLNDSDDWCKTVSNWITNWSNVSSTVKVDSEKINA